MQRTTRTLAVLGLAVGLVYASAAALAGKPSGTTQRRPLAARPVFERLIHVPGPNPILRSGGPGAWDENVIEAGNVFKDGHTYYLYYHGYSGDSERWQPDTYRIGVATATHPLGPWTKYGDAPVLDLGPEDSWDSGLVACPVVLREGEDTYYMWYSGDWPPSIGLATASSPLGPWTKYEKNPVMEDFGYVGGVVKVGDKYYMYAEWPIDLNSPDQGPFCLAIADRPEGPWKRYEGNPILEVEGWGTWDDGGYSEAGVIYHEGIFHTFYGGTKWEKLESVGYAYSFDGKTFHKHPQNPVIMRERCPGVSAFAEVHSLFEAPLFYVYATERYIDSLDEDSSSFDREYISAHVLATSRPFRFDMPVIATDGLGAGAETDMDDCPPISTENINSFALTVECSYGAAAKAGLRAKVFPSYDGLHYDTEPTLSFDNFFQAGQCCRRTVAVDPAVKFAKVVLENLDGSNAVTDAKVVATLGCL